MPFARRDAQGRIVALLAEPQPDAREAIDAFHPDVARFLGQAPGQGAVLATGQMPPAPPSFSEMDGHMARVTEDLIDVLVARGVVMFTDLPPIAQRKLLERRRLREAGATAPASPLTPESDELI